MLFFLLPTNSEGACVTGPDFLPPRKNPHRLSLEFLIRRSPHTNSAPRNGSGPDFLLPPSTFILEIVVFWPDIWVSVVGFLRIVQIYCGIGELG